MRVLAVLCLLTGLAAAQDIPDAETGIHLTPRLMA